MSLFSHIQYVGTVERYVIYHSRPIIILIVDLYGMLHWKESGQVLPQAETLLSVFVFRMKHKFIPGHFLSSLRESFFELVPVMFDNKGRATILVPSPVPPICTQNAHSKWSFKRQ